jgi:hypothetical protein
VRAARQQAARSCVRRLDEHLRPLLDEAITEPDVATSTA